jgi:hypothetical protein
MHAVLIRVKISDPGSATSELTENVVPSVKQAPGFVAGYWTRSDNEGVSLVVFESEEQANAAAERVPSGVPDSVELQSVEVREVVASA